MDEFAALCASTYDCLTVPDQFILNVRMLIN